MVYSKLQCRIYYKKDNYSLYNTFVSLIHITLQFTRHCANKIKYSFLFALYTCGFIGTF